MHKKLYAAAAACVLALSACQSAEDVIAKYNSTVFDGYDTSHIEADPDIVAMVPAEVAADGKLTIGSNLYWAPAEFQQGGVPVGYEIDMMKAVAARMGLELDVQNAEFDSILPGIPVKYEMGVSSFTITADREKNFDMIQYHTAGTAWAVQKDNPTDFDPTDICGRTIGVQTGTTQDDTVQKAAKACDKKPDIQRYDSQDAVTQALQGGKVEAMAADSPVIEYAAQKTNGALEVTGEITDTAPMGIVTAKNGTLTPAVMAALQSLMDDGTLDQIMAAWGIEENVSTTAVLNPAVS